MERRAGGPAVEVSNPGTDAGLGDQSPWALTPPDGTCLGKRNLSTEAGVGMWRLPLLNRKQNGSHTGSSRRGHWPPNSSCHFQKC